jgi:hypothetical protein
MSRQLAELEHVLGLMVVEHRKLLEQVQAQHLAMRAMQAEQMQNITALQESTRLRIATLDAKRRQLAVQIGKLIRLPENGAGTVEPTLAQLSQAFPARAVPLRRLRDELRTLVAAIQSRTTIGARLAGAVLGHLNTAVRLIAGAVEHAGVYTKHGTPRVAARIGAIEAIG